MLEKKLKGQLDVGKQAKECCRGNCAAYRGKLSTTVYGKKCLPWANLHTSHHNHPDKYKSMAKWAKLMFSLSIASITLYKPERAIRCVQIGSIYDAWITIFGSLSKMQTDIRTYEQPLFLRYEDPDNNCLCYRKPNSGLESNYCRNPSGHEFAWCYIKIQGGTRWQNCRIPSCSDPIRMDTIKYWVQEYCKNTSQQI